MHAAEQPREAQQRIDVGRLHAHALRDLEAYLKLARLSEQDEDQKQETEQVWEHVKTLRRRVAQLN